MSSHEGQPLPGYPLGPPPMTQSPAWPTPSNGRGLKIAIAALAVLLLIAVAGAGFAAIQWQAANARVAQAQDGAHAVTAAAEEARAVADRYAVALTSIDSSNVDANTQTILEGATGQFKEQYAKSSAQLRQLLIDNKATATGKVVESAVQSATAAQVVILLFVDQTVTNATAPEPRVDKSRIKMTMEKVDGRWLAGKVDIA